MKIGDVFLLCIIFVSIIDVTDCGSRERFHTQIVMNECTYIILRAFLYFEPEMISLNSLDIFPRSRDFNLAICNCICFHRYCLSHPQIHRLPKQIVFADSRSVNGVPG